VRAGANGDDSKTFFRDAGGMALGGFRYDGNTYTDYFTRTIASDADINGKVNTLEFDIIKGWRADASYFSIVKRFVRDEIDLNLIPKLFKLGDLGIQYCVKSNKAFETLDNEYIPICKVDAKEFIDKYSEKDTVARDSINKIIESRDNTMQDVFSKYI
jgi:hypothetical protein